MRILHVYQTYYPENVTGGPRVIHELSEELARQGVESHVLALHKEGNAVPLKLGRHYVHQARRHLQLASTGLSFDVFGRFRSLLQTADVVHYHFPWPLADILHLLHGRRKPALVTYHSDIVKQRGILPFYAPVMHRFLARADAIVATSPIYAQTSPTLIRYREKVAVIPIGIGDRIAPDTAAVEKWRARLGEGFLLFVGALRYYKGINFLIEAARLTGLPVVLVGSNEKKQLNADHLPANVTYLGEVSDADKEALLMLCSAFVFPSHLRSEAFGVALLEAARAARPMISCNIGTGTSYVNIHGETGLVVEPANPRALAQAMTRLAGDRHTANRLGENARRRYDRLFHASDMANGYLQLYRRIGAAHAARAVPGKAETGFPSGIAQEQ